MKKYSDKELIELVNSGALEFSDLDIKDITRLYPPPTWMEVTPAMAQEWLANQTKNRPLRRHQVDALANDMARFAGWRPCDGAVTIMKDAPHGCVNGQHRLHSLLKGKSKHKTMLVSFWPVKSALELMTDRNISRTISDLLEIPHTEATIFRQMFLCVYATHGKATPTDVKIARESTIDAVGENTYYDLLECVMKSNSTKTIHGPTRAAVMGLAVAYPNYIDQLMKIFNDYAENENNLPFSTRWYQSNMMKSGTTSGKLGSMRKKFSEAVYGFHPKATAGNKKIAKRPEKEINELFHETRRELQKLIDPWMNPDKEAEAA